VEGEVRSIVYPPGKSVRFAFSDRPLDIYAGDVVVRGEAAASATSVSVTYQACDESRCLRPVTRAVPFGE
jgi:hypothetical protein